MSIAGYSSLEFPKFAITFAAGVAVQKTTYFNSDWEMFAANSYFPQTSSNGDTVFIVIDLYRQPESKLTTKYFLLMNGEINFEYQIGKSGLLRPFFGLAYQHKIFPFDKTADMNFVFYQVGVKEIGRTSWSDNLARLSFQFGLKAQLPFRKRVKQPE